MNKDIKICFMGSPRFGENVLEKLIEEYTVVLVVTQPDTILKGGKVVIEQPVKKLALKYNIPIFQPENIKQDFEMMKNYEFDFLVTAAYGQFIPLDVLHLPKILTLNVHGSLLPKYRGGAPIQRAIMAGDEYLGVTIMRTILKMDAGAIYKQSKIKLEEDDNYETMVEKLSHQGSLDLIEVIDRMYSDFDSVIPTHQTIEDVTFAGIIKKEDEFIDFNDTALNVFNKIRALYKNPTARFIYNNENYQVLSSCVVIDDSCLSPGTVIDNKKSLIIKCKENAISIKEIKPQGKNLMDVKSFLNGYRSRFSIGEKI